MEKKEKKMTINQFTVFLIAFMAIYVIVLSAKIKYDTKQLKKFGFLDKQQNGEQSCQKSENPGAQKSRVNPLRVLTVMEQLFYERLKKALPEYVICCQVHLLQLVRIDKDNHGAQEALKRSKMMSVDFVVCRQDFSVIAAIELDDSSHELPHRRKADNRKNYLLAVSGIPLIRWKTNALPDPETIREQIVKLDELPKICNKLGDAL